MCSYFPVRGGGGGGGVGVKCSLLSSDCNPEAKARL